MLKNLKLTREQILQWVISEKALKLVIGMAIYLTYLMIRAIIFSEGDGSSKDTLPFFDKIRLGLIYMQMPLYFAIVKVNCLTYKGINPQKYKPYKWLNTFFYIFLIVTVGIGTAYVKYN